jgi:hypothetical protein
MKRLLIALLGLTLGLAAMPLAAQQATSQPIGGPTATLFPAATPGSVIMVIGPVLFSDNQATVNGYVLAPVPDVVPPVLVQGAVVIVTGALQPDGLTLVASEFEYFGEPVTPTPDPNATALPTPTPGPTMTAGPTATPEPCDRPDHPIALQLAAAFEVSYEEIVGWRCADFGFGEIARAYLLAAETGLAPQAFLDMKAGGVGWGQIVRDAGLEGSQRSLLAPGQSSNRGSGQGSGFGNGNGQGAGNGGQGGG